MKNKVSQKNIPKGWQIKQFEDCVILPAKLKGLKNSEYKPFGKYPIFDQAKEYISGYTDERDVLNENYPAILFGDHTRVLKYIKSPFALGADGTKVFWSKDDIDSSFLYYSLLNLNIPNTGYNRHFKLLKDAAILLPEKFEQEKIAEILSTVDEEIQKIDLILSETEKLKNGLMHELFTRGIGHKKFRKTKLGNLPEDWQVVTLGEIGTNIIGLTYSPEDVVSDGGTLVLRSSNIFGNTLKYEDTVFVNKKIPENLITKEGDILLCTRNGSRNLIGKNAYIDERSAGNSFGAFMSVYRTKYSKFVFQLFQSKFFKDQINQYLGATINQITTKSLNSFIFPLPPIQEQEKISNILSSIDQKISVSKELRAKLIELKQGLMSDLLSGKVRTK